MLQNEIRHFNRLSNNAKRLVISYFLYGLGIPLISTFLNAFIWRGSHDFVSLIVYNVGMWIALPFIFFLNGILLQYISTSFLYTAGLILTALATFLLIILSLQGYTALFILGLVFGVGFGFYWANRTFYTMRLTEDSNRNYFYSLTFTVDTITGIIVPFIVGWIIVFGGDLSYKILAVLLFGIYLTAGLVSIPLTMRRSEHAHGILAKVKGKWNTMRVVTFLFGFQSGSNFIFPSLVVLYLLGNEGVLGTVTSLGALFTALVIYQIGKVSLAHHRLYIFMLGVIILTLITIIFALYPASFGVIVYVVGITLVVNLTWAAYSPILMDVIDQYTPTKKQNRFKYLVDHEFFINLGRIGSTGIFLFLYFTTSKLFSLRFTPFVIATLQIIVVLLLRKIVGKRDEKSVLL